MTTPNTITITLPLPPAALKPNARPHYMTKARAAKQYRVAAQWEAFQECGDSIGPRWKAATVTLRWFTKTRRRPDADNALASMKAAFDGLTDAGVWADDRNTRFEPIEWGVDKCNPRVEVVVKEIGA